MMKNFDATATNNAAAGTAMVNLYVDACMAANHVILEYTRLLTALVWQTCPLPPVAALLNGVAADQRRDVPVASPGRHPAPASASPDGTGLNAHEPSKAASHPPVATVPAPRKVAHKKPAAAPAVGRRAGVAKRRVRAH